MKKKNYNKPASDIKKKEYEEYEKAITEGILNVLSSDKWKQYLDMQTKFHSYSFNNIILILSQRPNATRIASESKWKEFDRNIKPGAKPIQIYAPTYKKYSNKPKLDLEELDLGDNISATGTIVKKIFQDGDYGIYILQIESINCLDKSGYINITGNISNEVKIGKTFELSGEISKYKGLKQIKVDYIDQIFLASSYTKQVRVGFTLVDVYDLNDTEGKDLPVGLCAELVGNSENSIILFNTVKDICEIPVIEENITSGAKGYFDYSDPSKPKILYTKNLSFNQKCKTLIHEYSHYKIFEQEIDFSEYMDGSNSKRGRYAAEEIVVESVAYIICSRFGIDTSSYSFEYVASWSGGDISKVKKLGNLIQQVSNDVINKIHTKFTELQDKDIEELEAV